MMKEIDDDVYNDNPNNDSNNDEIEHIPVVVGSFQQIRKTMEERFRGKDWRIIMGGQILSFLLAATGAASATLHFECNLSAPTAQMGLVYFLLSFRAIDSLRNNNNNNNKGRKKMLRMVLYPLIAFLDVEANYFTFLAFRYTTLNSVSIFDALAIPSAMICSRLLLRVTYSSIHYYGALICMLGVILNVIRDYTDSSDQNSRMKEEYPHQLLGDSIAIIGGLLHGFRDVMTEYAVKHLQQQQSKDEKDEEKETHDVDTNEYLGMIGVFGVIISIIQCILLERTAIHEFFQPHNNNNNNNYNNNHRILSTTRWLEDVDPVYNMTTNNSSGHNNDDDDEYFMNNAWYTVTFRDHHSNSTTSAADYGGFELPTCSESMGLWILMGYVLATYGTYVGTSRFLVVSEAAFLNLSLLTGDLWAVLFSVVAEHILPKPLFWIALFLIMGGVLTYEMAPTPMVVIPNIHSTSHNNDTTTTNNNNHETSPPPMTMDHHHDNHDMDTHSMASSCSGQYSSIQDSTCTSSKGRHPIVEFAPSYVVFSEPDKAAGSPRQDSVVSTKKSQFKKKKRFGRNRKINQKAASALFLVDGHHDLELVVTV